MFSPTAIGGASGTLTVSSPLVTQAATVPLSATGYSFSVSNSGPTSQTVTSGQEAIYKLLLTPNGAQGTFSFRCGTLPANAKCVFNPTTETLSAGAQGNVQVEIYTGDSGLNVRLERLWGVGGGVLACGVVLLPLTLRRRRGIFLVVLLGAFVIATISSCSGSGGGTTVGSGGSGGSGGNGGGSGSSGGSGANSTPAGTYSVPVSITSAGATQSVTLTLTVD